MILGAFYPGEYWPGTENPAPAPYLTALELDLTKDPTGQSSSSALTLDSVGNNMSID